MYLPIGKERRGPRARNTFCRTRAVGTQRDCEGRIRSGLWRNSTSQDFAPFHCIIPGGERRIDPSAGRCLYERVQAKKTVFLKQVFGSEARFEGVFQIAVDYGAAPLHSLIIGWKFPIEVTVALVLIMKMIVDKNLVVVLAGFIFRLWLARCSSWPEFSQQCNKCSRAPRNQCSNPSAADKPAYHPPLSAGSGIGR
jgi:hypothetical protein